MACLQQLFLELEEVKMITLTVITLYNWRRKDSMYEKVYIPPNLCDIEVSQRGKITEGLC